MANQTLAHFFGVDRLDFKLVDPARFVRSSAFLAIDVQRRYADPSYQDKRGTWQTDKVAGRIAALTPQFRRAGLEMVWAYYYRPGFEKNPLRAHGGWHRVRPLCGDTVLGKTGDSLFSGTSYAGIQAARALRARGVRNLLVSGFNTNACVKETVTDALARGFNVCVLRDLTENDRCFERKSAEGLHEMAAQGACIESSYNVLNVLKRSR